jgi:UDP-perosamine 4-acetyltransferase
LAADSHDVRAFAVAGIAAGKSTLLGIEIVEEKSFLASPQFEGIEEVLVCIGDNASREAIANRLSSLMDGRRFARVIHPRATVASSAVVGNGTVILAHAAVNPMAHVGAHACLWTGAILEHDCHLGDFATLAPAAVTGGNVTIGARSFLGVGARVIHGRSIGTDTVVGAGAVVANDLPDGVVAVGVPATAVKSRKLGQPYL